MICSHSEYGASSITIKIKIFRFVDDLARALLFFFKQNGQSGGNGVTCSLFVRIAEETRLTFAGSFPKPPCIQALPGKKYARKNLPSQRGEISSIFFDSLHRFSSKYFRIGTISAGIAYAIRRDRIFQNATSQGL